MRSWSNTSEYMENHATIGLSAKSTYTSSINEPVVTAIGADSAENASGNLIIRYNQHLTRSPSGGIRPQEVPLVNHGARCREDEVAPVLADRFRDLLGDAGAGATVSA